MPALIHSYKVEEALEAGNLKSAKKNSKISRLLNIWATCFTLILVILVVVLMFAFYQWMLSVRNSMTTLNVYSDSMRSNKYIDVNDYLNKYDKQSPFRNMIDWINKFILNKILFLLFFWFDFKELFFFWLEVKPAEFSENIFYNCPLKSKKNSLTICITTIIPPR